MSGNPMIDLINKYVFIFVLVWLRLSSSELNVEQAKAVGEEIFPPIIPADLTGMNIVITGANTGMYKNKHIHISIKYKVDALDACIKS